MSKAKKPTTEEQILAELAKEQNAEDKREDKIKTQFKNDLRGLINVTGLYRWLNDHDYWMPEGFFKVKETDEKCDGYPDHQCARIVNEKFYLYMKCKMYEQIRGIKDYYVWQTTGSLGDDYSGFLLFKLNNGRYFKVSYGC